MAARYKDHRDAPGVSFKRESPGITSKRERESPRGRDRDAERPRRATTAISFKAAGEAVKANNRVSAGAGGESFKQQAKRRGSTRLVRVADDEPPSLHDRTSTAEYDRERHEDRLLASPLPQRAGMSKAKSKMSLALNRAVGRPGPKRSALKDPFASKTRSAWKRSRRVHFSDENTESVLAAGGILLPRDWFLHVFWSQSVVVALTAELVLWPMRLPWPVPWAYDIGVDVVFIFEIIITLRSAFVTQAGVLEVQPRAIRANYLRLRGMFDSNRENSFWLDIAALLPLHITTLLGAKRWIALLGTIPRLNRIILLSRHFRRAEMDIKILNVQQIALFKYGLMLLGAPHWWACLWWYVATTHEDDDPLGNSTWLHQSVFSMCLPDFNTHHSPPSDSVYFSQVLTPVF